jgi:molybdopterin converting factor small subunit
LVTQKVGLYGTARVLAGCPGVDIQVPAGASVREVLRALGRRYPSLGGSVLLPDYSGLSAGYAANINGLTFVSDPDEPLQNGDILLLIPAAAGGGDRR